MWFRCSHGRGFLPKAVHVDDLEEFDFRLCELCRQDSAPDDSAMTFYLQSGEGDMPSGQRRTSVLLFFLLLDPRLDQLEYLGSASAGEDDRLFSFCVIHVDELREELEDRDYAFFVVDSETSSREISSVNSTVAEVHPCLLSTGI